MACFAFNGLPPDPPRVWSRVQGVCSTLPVDTITPVEADVIAMASKGNILQYKNNSSNITKQQRYSQIAKGQWTNRNTTWASQAITTTMPNTQSLKRVNYKTIYLDNGAPADGLPITCPTPVEPTIPRALPTNPNVRNTSIQLNNNEYGIRSNLCPIYVTPPGPPIYINGGPYPEVPKKPIDPIILPVLPVIKPPPNPPARVVIPDGGNLICNITENICTGEILSITQADNNCNPSSASDVPGPVIPLCYNNGLPTYYPRQRYIMTNSGNKFPVGYKCLGSQAGIDTDILCRKYIA